MKIKKRITIVADVLVDEDFDTDKYLLIAQDISDQVQYDGLPILVGCSDDFEVLDYIDQFIEEIEGEI